MSSELFPLVKEFDILEFDPLLSDIHRPICISLACNDINDYTNADNADLHRPQCESSSKPTWKSEAKLDFVNAFDRNLIAELTQTA